MGAYFDISVKFSTSDVQVSAADVVQCFIFSLGAQSVLSFIASLRMTIGPQDAAEPMVRATAPDNGAQRLAAAPDANNSRND